MFDFLSFNKQVASVRSQKDGLINQVKNKRAEIDALRNSPPPKADVVSLLCGDGGVVDRLAANFDAAWEFNIHRLCRHPLNPERVNGVGIFTAAPPNAAPSITSIEAVLLALFCDEVKAALRKRIEAMPWPNAGPSIKERPALIEKAEHALAALEKDLVELQRQAAEAGVLI